MKTLCCGQFIKRKRISELREIDLNRAAIIYIYDHRLPCRWIRVHTSWLVARLHSNFVGKSNVRSSGSSATFVFVCSRTRTGLPRNILHHESPWGKPIMTRISTLNISPVVHHAESMGNRSKKMVIYPCIVRNLGHHFTLLY
jgi:hypothetical protein